MIETRHTSRSIPLTDEDRQIISRNDALHHHLQCDCRNCIRLSQILAMQIDDRHDAALMFAYTDEKVL
jgi:hypothetical protein